MYSRLSRNAETGDSDKEALFASAGGVGVSEFLGGELDKRLEKLGAAARQATRTAQAYASCNILEVALSKMKTG